MDEIHFYIDYSFLGKKTGIAIYFKSKNSLIVNFNLEKEKKEFTNNLYLFKVNNNFYSPSSL